MAIVRCGRAGLSGGILDARLTGPIATATNTRSAGNFCRGRGVPNWRPFEAGEMRKARP